MDTRTLTLFGLLVAASSLGCLLSERDQLLQEPFDEPRDGEGIDDPWDPDFRGFFDLTLEGDERTTLTSRDVGEATYTYVAEDPLGDPPHCLVTLADRTPDDSGLQGYVLLQYFGSGCPGEGTYSLLPREEARERDGALTLKTIAIDVDADGAARSTSYREASGEVTIEEGEAGRLGGTIDARARARRGDPEDGPADLSLTGDFALVPR